MNHNPRPARVSSPGHIITRKLEDFGWSQKDLAEVTGRPPQAINEIIQGIKQVTPETALELAAAFGTSAELWMNLEIHYRLHRARKDDREAIIARRSRLYALAPVPELIKRGWVEKGSSLDDLERSVCALLRIPTPNEAPPLVASLRKSAQRPAEIGSLAAWIRRAELLAEAQSLPPFDPARLRWGLSQLLNFTRRAEGVAEVRPFLHSLGIHFVIVPHLSKTYLDGAVFWIGDRPAVALTLRFDRIDAFWFTLLHELAHIVERHEGNFLDNSIEEGAASEDEQIADKRAREWLIAPSVFSSFVTTNRGRFARSVIESFASAQNRHPGIVVGQLQHSGDIDWSQHRALLVKVRPYLEDWVDEPGPPGGTLS